MPSILSKMTQLHFIHAHANFLVATLIMVVRMKEDWFVKTISSMGKPRRNVSGRIIVSSYIEYVQK